MRVLALNSSPHKSRGGTSAVLAPFLEGVRSAGAETELVYLHGLEIRPCRGCYTCWLKTPGRCAQRDAMDELLPKVEAADALVYATPVYIDGMNAQMKLFVDRCLPLIEPWFEVKNGHCRHPRRLCFRPTRAVLVSACGFTELDNFDPLVAHMQAACRNMGLEYAGALLRPYASSLAYLQKLGLPVKDVLDACADAGREFVTAGSISDKTAARVSRSLVRRDRHVKSSNDFFRAHLRKHALPARPHEHCDRKRARDIRR